MSDRVFAEEKKWYFCRDTLFGDNRIEQDVPKALQLAKACTHPDAVWLNSVVENALIFCARDLAGLLKEEKYKEDARALCFVYMLDRPSDIQFALLLKAAKFGYVFANVLVINLHLGPFCSKEDLWNSYNRLQECVGSRERTTFYVMGVLLKRLQRGNEAKKYFVQAAELDHYHAIHRLACEMPMDDPKTWYWNAKLAKLGVISRLTESCLNELLHDQFVITFGVGKVAKIILGLKTKQEITSEYVEGEKFYNEFVEASKTYEKQLSCARQIIDTWTLCAKRMFICKDMRKHIGEMIWKDRDLISYLF